MLSFQPTPPSADKPLQGQISVGGLQSVHAIELGNVKAFIIEGEKTVLVDTGVKPVPDEILLF